MRYREFGSIGYRVSALGFGAMNLPGVSYEQAEAALNYALDHGINYIDTAAAYRNSEEIVGNAIAHRRKEFFLATKTVQRSYDSAKADIERSLERLKTDVIDLLQIREKLFSCADYEPCKEKPLCEEKCPYHLPISTVVRESVSYFTS